MQEGKYFYNQQNESVDAQINKSTTRWVWVFLLAFLAIGVFAAGFYFLKLKNAKDLKENQLDTQLKSGEADEVEKMYEFEEKEEGDVVPTVSDNTDIEVIDKELNVLDQELQDLDAGDENIEQDLENL